MATGTNFIGPYRLLKLIRAGSATHVWEAMDSLENKRYALKSLQPEFCKDRAHISSLKHEYTVGHKLDHPNVNKVYEFDVAKGVPYVVLEYFNAPNLKQRLRMDHALILEKLESIIRQGAEGLAHLHSHNWVHRDVKPDNLLMDDDGTVKLIDFAISQAVKRGLGKLLSGRSRTIQGTRSYMAPEQIRGDVVDPRADIYAFGCMIFEMSTGKLPYTGTTANDLLNKHVRGSVPSVLPLNETLDKSFGDLVASCMAKKPDDRPDSMEAVLELLDANRVFKRTHGMGS